MIDFIRAEDLRLMPRFLLLVADFTRANTTEFHLCEHGGFFAVAAKIINQMSGLERKFYNAITLKFRRSLNWRNASAEFNQKISNLVVKFRAPKF